MGAVAKTTLQHRQAPSLPVRQSAKETSMSKRQIPSSQRLEPQPFSCGLSHKGLGL